MIFVAGSSRSGTTMMGRVLAKNPAIYTFNELHFFEQLWDPSDNDNTIDRLEAYNLVARLCALQYDGYLGAVDSKAHMKCAVDIVDKIPANEMRPSRLYGSFLNYIINLNQKKLSCDQTPRNILFTKEILDLYPEAKIIMMVRDPRDVLASQKYKWKRRFLGAKNISLKEAFRSWLNYHPYTITILWKATLRVCNQYKDHPRVEVVRYEDFVDAPELKLKEICEFLSIDYSIEMLSVPKAGSSHGTDRELSNGISKRVNAAWKNGVLNNAEIAICQKIAADDMRKWSYETVVVDTSIFAMAMYMLLIIPKSIGALAMNLNRTRNLIKSIKRRTGKL